MSRTLQQQRALALVPKASGLLSLLGSSFIILDIVKSRHKLSRTYSRIVLLMACFDMTTSIAQGLSTWPIPEESGILYASGNQMSCNAQGFFTQLGVGAPITNFSLSVYYLMVMAMPMLDQARLKQIEWTLHGIPLVFAFSTAIMGLPLTLYNSAGLWCWISALPGSCGNAPNSVGDCIRGDNAWVYRWAIYYAPVWFCVVTITINMTIVSYYVWVSEKQILSTRANSNGQTESELLMEEENKEEENEGEGELSKALTAESRASYQSAEDKTASLSSQIFWQAFYYVGAFYITWISPTVLRFLQTIGKPVPYYIILLMAILLPLQGFFNFLIYVRPRIVQYRNQQPKKGVWSATARALQATIMSNYHESTDHEDEKNTETLSSLFGANTAHFGSELFDVQTLDPCYAMQVQREEQAIAATRRRRVAHANAGLGNNTEKTSPVNVNAMGESEKSVQILMMEDSEATRDFKRLS